MSAPVSKTYSVSKAGSVRFGSVAKAISRSIFRLEVDGHALNTHVLKILNLGIRFMFGNRRC
jgi:hypothetical protein